SVFSGAVATFANTNPANPSTDFTATIDWGDGTTTTGTVTGGAGTFTVSGSHTYTSSGTKSLSVTLADDAPGTAQATAHSTASVSGDVVITGTPGDDTLSGFRTSGGPTGSLTYSLNGAPSVSLTGVSSFTFDGLAGNDTMTVRLTNGGPLTNGVVSF